MAGPFYGRGGHSPEPASGTSAWPWSGRQSILEERDHLVQRIVGGVAGLVDEMLGQHRMRVLGDPVRVALGRVDLDADEAVAELTSERLEALLRHELVVREPKTEHVASCGRPRLHGCEVGGREPDRASSRLRHRDRERRLAQHGSDRRLVEHHPESEAAGEAHADRTDARSPTFGVHLLREHTQPQRDRRRLVGGERGELLRDARRDHRLKAVADRRLTAGLAEHGREHGGEPFVGESPPEGSDLRADARHLGHHDDAGPRADAEQRVRAPLRGEREAVESVEGVGRRAGRGERHGARPYRPTRTMSRSTSRSTPSRMWSSASLRASHR